MKVSTDGCIFGAYTSEISGLPTAAQKVLDIGTGTGLLSLMLAQKLPSALIEAVETDFPACEQASENFRNSPWSDRLKVCVCAVQEFYPGKQYDLIICNPPFYAGHLRSRNPQRKQAFHQETLNFPDLAKALQRLLAPEGEAGILLPLRQAAEFTASAKQAGLYCSKELLIAERKSSKPHRSIRTFTFSHKEHFPQETFVIRADDGTYSPAFQKLLQPFYTIF